MDTIRRIVNRTRSWLGAGARTVGVSPKLLAPFIAAGITAGLAELGASPAELAELLGVSTELAAGMILTVAGAVAAWLLPPGNVVTADPRELVGIGNDSMLPTEAIEGIAAVDVPSSRKLAP